MAEPPTQEQVDEWFETALALVKAGNDVVNQAILKRDKVVDEKSSATDLVTDTDKALEKLIVDGLRSKFKDHKFIGEETTSANDDNVDEFTDDPTWIIDPVDGTMNFVHGNPLVSISVGLVVNKVLTIGIVSAPAINALYTAKRGQGAYLNGQKVQATACKDLEQSLFLMELWARPIQASLPTFQLDNLGKLLSRCAAVRSLGSAAINLALVAAGQADAYSQCGIRCWDMAAGALIVKESGGVLLDPRDGSEFDLMSRGILAASTPSLAKAVLDLQLQYHSVDRDHPKKGRAE